MRREYLLGFRARILPFYCFLLSRLNFDCVFTPNHLLLAVRFYVVIFFLVQREQFAQTASHGSLFQLPSSAFAHESNQASFLSLNRNSEWLVISELCPSSGFGFFLSNWYVIQRKNSCSSQDPPRDKTDCFNSGSAKHAVEILWATALVRSCKIDLLQGWYSLLQANLEARAVQASFAKSKIASDRKVAAEGGN